MYFKHCNANVHKTFVRLKDFSLKMISWVETCCCRPSTTNTILELTALYYLIF
jgi:hypothetical protein